MLPGLMPPAAALEHADLLASLPAGDGGCAAASAALAPGDVRRVAAVGGRDLDLEREALLWRAVLACLMAAIEGHVSLGAQPREEVRLDETVPQASARRAWLALGRAAACGMAVRPDRYGGEGERLGLGLYPLAAATLNHSCDPNCSIR
jgi:hypothetical protein